MNNYILDFITEENFDKHVTNTLLTYNQNLEGINLKTFNSNIIDPIKLLFDKNIYQKTYEEIINMELQRQRDKSNTNAIGYFHQNIFKYIQNCNVPIHGWDVVFQDNEKNIYVEMKNKHNTMNSSAAQKTYMRMQNHIMNHPKDYCYLVEVIAPLSRNIKWGCSVDGKHLEHEHIRRVSINIFYTQITGEQDAFFKICLQLPKTIQKLLEKNEVPIIQPDTVLDELRRIHPNMLYALYLLAFQTYDGFVHLNDVN